jgi:hypothetical protein
MDAGEDAEAEEDNGGGGRSEGGGDDDGVVISADGGPPSTPPPVPVASPPPPAPSIATTDPDRRCLPEVNVDVVTMPGTKAGPPPPTAAGSLLFRHPTQKNVRGEGRGSCNEMSAG